MRQKKLMLLGGIRYLLPVIEAAHEQGYYVITADYLPDNIAHRYSDEYVNVSIIDKEAVLKVAREKEIDGILSFGVDPGVVSASYVQTQMGIPSLDLSNRLKYYRIRINLGLFCQRTVLMCLGLLVFLRWKMLWLIQTSFLTL